MISKYKDGQTNFFDVMINQIKNNKLSHAYLIDTSNNTNALDIVIDIVKYILCPSNCFSDCCNEECNICLNIDNNVFHDFRIIKPDGLWIKKEQLIELQKEFSKKSTFGSKKIYIICEADKLNLSASNTMLKFLEEPDDDITAFLLTNNINLIIDTIKSRCQLIKLNSNSSNDLGVSSIHDIIDFIKCLEFDYEMAIVNEKQIFLDLFKNRLDFISAFDKMITIYELVLKYKLGNISLSNKEELAVIEDICSKNEIDKIINKLEIIIKSRDNIKSNVNLGLMLDNFIIEFGGE